MEGGLKFQERRKSGMFFGGENLAFRLAFSFSTRQQIILQVI